ncbi:MAG: RES family NAD+ phosphorylase [Chitinophagaceae bacterium]|nr:RES family NAD+ phosphorylase [Chitinophagaceae bacterium]
MKLYCITDCKFVNDLTGYGAALTGGRWNSKSVFLLYTSQNSSLAQLETIKHFDTGRRYISGKCLLVLNVPARSVRTITAANLGRGWRNDPAPKYLQKIGDFFYHQNRYLILKVPSALNPEEYNFIINPRHKDFSKIKIISSKPITIDRRLLKNPVKSKKHR